MANETDIRVEFFNSFLSCPHRDMDQIYALHKSMQTQDPDFYGHLACWYYNQPNNIRDHNELFCSLLATDEYIPNRDIGLALFRRHHMSMKNKIVGYIKGKTVKIREKVGMKTINGKKKKVPDIKITEKKVGLNKNLPTALRTEIAGYLRWLEENPDLFDAEVLRNAKALKSLYFSRGKHAFSHGNRAQKVLFDKEYPEDSRLSVYKKIMEAKSPKKVAELIVTNKIPYTVAVGLIEKITPTILVALVDSMSPQELINNLASLKQNGAYDNPELKEMILAKLEKAKKSRSVAALKGKTAKSTGRIADKEIEDKLDEVADVSVKKAGTIRMKTSIMVDKSSSMSTAIDLGKRVAALISGVTEADLYVLAFDTVSREIKAKGPTLTDWEKAFVSIRPSSMTSIGSAMDFLLRKKYLVEQVVIITDEDENAHPMFVDAYKDYQREMKVSPQIVIINMEPRKNKLSTRLSAAGIQFDRYDPKGGDYYALPGLVTLLSRRSMADLIYEIMDMPLFNRKPYPKPQTKEKIKA